MTEEETALARILETDTDIERVTTTSVAVLNRSEVEAQLDAAHKYRRSIGAFLREAQTLATLTRPVAESCIYSVPRDGKVIAGPSVRLAEICASAYGNLHLGARIIDVEDKEVVAQGVGEGFEDALAPVPGGLRGDRGVGAALPAIGAVGDPGEHVLHRAGGDRELLEL